VLFITTLLTLPSIPVVHVVIYLFQQAYCLCYLIICKYSSYLFNYSCYSTIQQIQKLLQNLLAIRNFVINFCSRVLLISWCSRSELQQLDIKLNVKNSFISEPCISFALWKGIRKCAVSNRCFVCLQKILLTDCVNSYSYHRGPSKTVHTDKSTQF